MKKNYVFLSTKRDKETMSSLLKGGIFYVDDKNEFLSRCRRKNFL